MRCAPQTPSFFLRLRLRSRLLTRPRPHRRAIGRTGGGSTSPLAASQRGRSPRSLLSTRRWRWRGWWCLRRLGWLARTFEAVTAAQRVMLILMFHDWCPSKGLGLTHSAGRRSRQSHYSIRKLLYISSLNHPISLRARSADLPARSGLVRGEGGRRRCGSGVGHHASLLAPV